MHSGVSVIAKRKAWLSGIRSRLQCNYTLTSLNDSSLIRLYFMLLGPDRPKFLVSVIKNDNYVIYCACVHVSQPCSLKLAVLAAWISVLEKKALRL